MATSSGCFRTDEGRPPGPFGGVPGRTGDVSVSEGEAKIPEIGALSQQRR